MSFLFIVSHSRSGSTVLDLALGSAANAVSVGEIVNLYPELAENRWCTCGQRYADCGFWSSVSAATSAHGLDLHSTSSAINLEIPRPGSNQLLNRLGVLLNIVGARTLNPAWLKDVHLLYNTILNVANKDVLIDSSKEITRALAIARYEKNTDCKFIHIVRDVRSVLQSVKKTSYHVKLPDNPAPQRYEQDVQQTTEQTIAIWERTNRKIENLLRLFINRNNRMRIKYEDLASEPERVLMEISEWSGIQYDAGMIRYGEHDHHNIGGNRTRFNTSEIISQQEDWSKHLTTEDLQLCAANVSGLMKKYGYS